MNEKHNNINKTRIQTDTKEIAYVFLTAVM